jgi:hypothetical protein
MVLSVLSVNAWAGTFELRHSFGVAANDGSPFCSRLISGFVGQSLWHGSGGRCLGLGY